MEFASVIVPERPDMESFNITVLGQFNRHIVEPGWAAKHDVVPSGDCEILLPLGGTAPIYRLGNGLSWTVLDDRLMVFGNPSEAPLFLEKLLGALPHTPLRAAGINFRIVLKVESTPKDHAASLAQIYPDTPIESSESRVYALRDGGKLAVITVWGKDTVSVTANFHLDTTDFKAIISHGHQIESFKEQTMELVKKLQC